MIQQADSKEFRQFLEENLDKYARRRGSTPLLLYGQEQKTRSSAPGEISVQRKQLKAIIQSLLPACTEPDIETGQPFRVQAIIANPQHMSVVYLLINHYLAKSDIYDVQGLLIQGNCKFPVLVAKSFKEAELWVSFEIIEAIGFVVSQSRIGAMTIFMAELWGIREGLRLIKDKGLRGIEMELDLGVIVKAIIGFPGMDSGSGTLLLDCKALLRQVDCIRVSHALREGN
nr:sterol 3-beta-glucosyltransferase UGT80B1 isoform X1 [Ipomoea batatas]